MFTQTLPSEITYLTSTKADGNFSFKYDSEATVVRNRSHFLEKHQRKLSQCVVMKTLNEDVMKVVGKTNQSSGAYSLKDVVEADALITTEPDVLLFLLTADCVPLTVYDPINKVIGLAHLSRESSKKHLAQKLVQRFIDEYGSDPTQLYAIFGPAVQKESYILEKNLTILSDEWGAFVTPINESQLSIDLTGFNSAQLIKAGLIHSQIITSTIDTASDSDYFSHYRAVRSGQEEGRFATIVGLSK